MAKSNEPFWWAFFSAGMMVGALLVPAMIVVTGFLVPLGLISPEKAYVLAEHWLTRILIFVVISLSLFHWAHRFRFTLVDLGLKGAASIIAALCYGSAILGTIAAAVFALKLV